MKAQKETQAVERWAMPAVPKEDQIAKRTASLQKQAAAISAITSEDHFVAAGAIIPRLDEAIKWITAVSSPFVAAMDKLHKQAVAFRRRKVDPLEQHKGRLLSLRMAWRDKCEREQRERDLKAARALQATQKRELTQAAKEAEKSGDSETAELFREQAAAAPVPIIHSAPPVPAQTGMYIKERWIYRIVKPEEVQREYCSPDDKLIRPIVESLGPQAPIKGIVIERDRKEHSRAVNA